MKLKLKNGEEYDVKFWSFVKCQIISQMAITIIMYGIIAVVLIILKIGGLI